MSRVGSHLLARLNIRLSLPSWYRMEGLPRMTFPGYGRMRKRWMPWRYCSATWITSMKRNSAPRNSRKRHCAINATGGGRWL